MKNLIASITMGLSFGAVLGALAAAVLFLCVYAVSAMAAEGSYFPEPAPAASEDAAEAPKQAEPVKAVSPPAPPAPIPTMKFSQQQTIVKPSEIRIGPGIACRMDDTVLACNLARPPIPEKE